MDESASKKKPREFWIQNPNTINQTATDVSVYDEEVNPSITEEIHVREVLENDISQKDDKNDMSEKRVAENDIMAPIFSNIRSDSQLELEQLREFKKEAMKVMRKIPYITDDPALRPMRAFLAKFGEQK